MNQHVAIITEQHENESWGERHDSTSTMGVLIQNEDEDYDTFVVRTRAKVDELKSETVRGRKQHYGVKLSIATVYEDELMA